MLKMLKIKIEKRNEQRIQAILDQLQKGARVRLLEPKDLFNLAERAERCLAELEIPKTSRPKAQATFGFHWIPRSYRGSPYGTIVGIERGRNAWMLAWAIRARCNRGGRNEIVLTKYQEERVLKRALEKATSL